MAKKILHNNSLNIFTRMEPIIMSEGTDVHLSIDPHEINTNLKQRADWSLVHDSITELLVDFRIVSVEESGQQIIKGEKLKREEYDSFIFTRDIFRPAIMDTSGTWNVTMDQLLQEISSRNPSFKNSIPEMRRHILLGLIKGLAAAADYFEKKIAILS